MTRISWLLAAAAAVGLAACGSGGSTAANTSGTSGSATTAATTTTSADHARAAAAVLTMSDLPSGWTSSPRSADPNVPGVDKQLAQCLGVSVGLLDKNDPSNVDSPDFNGPNGETVDNSVGFTPTQAEADQAFGVLSDPKAPQCLSTALNSYLSYTISHPKSSSDTMPPNTSLGHLTVAPLTFPTVGDKTVAYRVTIPLTADSQQLSIYVDFIVSAKGRAGSILTAENVGSPLGMALEQHLQTAVIGRLG